MATFHTEPFLAPGTW